VKEEITEVKAKIYPNPANHSFKIEFDKTPEESYKVTIFDVTGKEVLSKQVRDKVNTILVSDLAKGTYFVKAVRKERVIYTQKLLVE
jgi:hypothetical protein